VSLLQLRNLAGDTARVLNILLAVEDFPNRAGLRSLGIPNVYRENQRRPTWIVFKDHFSRRVRHDPAVPIKLPVDAYRRERGRKRAGREDVVDRDWLIAAVEIVHHAGTHVRGANGQPRPASVDQ
jgi:hypothetical protein